MIIWKGIFFCFCHQWKLLKKKKRKIWKEIQITITCGKDGKEYDSDSDALRALWRVPRFPFLKVRIDSHCGYWNHHQYSNNQRERERDILDFRIENPATVVSSIYQRILKGRVRQDGVSFYKKVKPVCINDMTFFKAKLFENNFFSFLLKCAKV